MKLILYCTYLNSNILCWMRKFNGVFIASEHASFSVFNLVDYFFVTFQRLNIIALLFSIYFNLLRKLVYIHLDN